MQAALLGSAALCLPLMLWIARRWEKKVAFIVAMASWAVVMMSVLVVPRGARGCFNVLVTFVGPGIAAAHGLPTAMSGDTLNMDELSSGRRQEGIYSGFEVFVRKLSTKLVLAAIGPILAWSGYIRKVAEQPPEALMTIRLLLAVVPGVVLVGAIVVAWRYPLTRERHRAIQAELARRRAAPAAPRFSASD